MLTKFRSTRDMEMCQAVVSAWFRKAWNTVGTMVLAVPVIQFMPGACGPVIVLVIVAGASYALVCAIRGVVTMIRWPG